MLDLIKTFVATIFFDKRYRYIFIFIIITLLYRFCQWLIIITQNPLMPVKFIQINRDGSIQMSIARFTQNMEKMKKKNYLKCYTRIKLFLIKKTIFIIVFY